MKIALGKFLTFGNLTLLSRKNFSSSVVVRAQKKAKCCSIPGVSPRVITPGNCREYKKPIASIRKRVALVIGGSNNGFGYSAAEQFLYNGARKVIVCDADEASGEFAVSRLNKLFGKERAVFYPCDPKNRCHVEGIFKASICRELNVSIQFNDLDAVFRHRSSPLPYCTDENLSNAMRLTRLGLEHIAAKETKKGGIIINCSTILGFTGWPKTPKPVYCYPESTIETTMDLAKQFPTEKTSLRLVVLCPANSTYESIGLPDDPNKIDLLQRFGSCKLICSPDPMKDRSRMGKALAHVTARAENGSCWFIEKPYTLRETPRLVRISRDDKDVESFNKQVAPCPVNYNVYKKNVSK